MSRLTELNDVLFPVEERPVFVGTADLTGDQPISGPEKKAIVDVKRRRVLGIVSRGYRLVNNSEALDWGCQCCRAVFPETKVAEWEVRTTDAPATAGHCFVDLVHNSTALDFNAVPAQDRPEVFGPFSPTRNSATSIVCARTGSVTPLPLPARSRGGTAFDVLEESGSPSQPPRAIMFWKRKPTVAYAVQDFQRLMQLIRGWAHETDQGATEDDIYRITQFVFAYFTHALHSTKMCKDEIASFVAQVSQENYINVRL
jgi:hypothetical protein